MKGKAFEILLGAVCTALVAVFGYLWVRMDGLEKQTGTLEKKLEAVEQTGAVALAHIEECKALAQEAISRNAQMQSGAEFSAMALFKQRGCDAKGT